MKLLQSPKCRGLRLVRVRGLTPPAAASTALVRGRDKVPHLAEPGRPSGQNLVWCWRFLSERKRILLEAKQPASQVAWVRFKKVDLIGKPSLRAAPVRSPQALGRALRRARTEAGLTQEELGTRIHSGRAGIISLESGHETRAITRMFDALAELGLELAVRRRA